MTVADVIDQIKALDPHERAKVLDLILTIESEQGLAKMDDQTFDQAANVVLQRHAELLRRLAQ